MIVVNKITSSRTSLLLLLLIIFDIFIGCQSFVIVLRPSLPTVPSSTSVTWKWSTIIQTTTTTTPPFYSNRKSIVRHGLAAFNSNSNSNDHGSCVGSNETDYSIVDEGSVCNCRSAASSQDNTDKKKSDTNENHQRFGYYPNQQETNDRNIRHNEDDGHDRNTKVVRRRKRFERYNSRGNTSTLGHNGGWDRRQFISRQVSMVATTAPAATASMYLPSNFIRENAAAAAAAIPPTSDNPDQTTSSLSSSSSNVAAIVEPFSSTRRYKSIQLKNGIRVVLVSDRTQSQSSAAVTIRGAGQFSDPPNLNGLAHLMEHMTLSSGSNDDDDNDTRPRGNSNRSRRKGGDFEEWLNGDFADGFSNGFTAYEKVCFHFQCNTDAFGEAIQRFATLFDQHVIERAVNGQTSNSITALRREIRRINSELDRNDLFTRELYLTKSLINPQHPYARMTMGSYDTLERIPNELDVDVGNALLEFYQRYYQPTRTVLVVVSPLSLSTLQSIVTIPFETTMSKRQPYSVDDTQRVFPPFFLPSGRFNGERGRRQTAPATTTRKDGGTSSSNSNNILYCIFRKGTGGGSESGTDLMGGEKLEKLSFQWALDRDYTELRTRSSSSSSSSSGSNVVTPTQIGFVLAEILGRRGPGSLYDLLKRRKWIPDGTPGVPRISFPVDVSGFQILRLELSLTLKGFAERASVVAAVYEGINSIPAGLNRELISQCCTVAQLYGHLLSPRPPDAIELSFDGQIYGVDGPKGIADPSWRLMPLPDDSVGVRTVLHAVMDVVQMIRDPTNAITIITASNRAIQYVQAQQPLGESQFPLFSPASWRVAPVTGARYYADNSRRGNQVTDWLLAKLLVKSEIDPPILNPLVPPYIRPPRSNYQSDNNFQFRLKNEVRAGLLTSFVSSPTSQNFPEDPTKTSIVRGYWDLLKILPQSGDISAKLKLPRTSLESSPRCLFICQFLSSRPPRASSQMAANAEVWKISLEYALSDLAELGSPAGLAYEISFNKYGLRVCFLGLSQNIASYGRRISRRIVDYPNKLLEGPPTLPDYVLQASRRNVNRFRMSPQRRAVLLNILKDVKAKDAALESISFFNSCSGAVCVAQGDITTDEALNLLADLKVIFKPVTGSSIVPTPAIPEVDDLLYGATWMPRSASACSIPGSSLVSNACGRVPR